jgi:hypothetical protein
MLDDERHADSPLFKSNNPQSRGVEKVSSGGSTGGSPEASNREKEASISSKEICDDQSSGRAENKMAGEEDDFPDGGLRAWIVVLGVRVYRTLYL